MQTRINPPGTERIYESWRFSQAVRVGDMLWVSGQVGIDASGTPRDGIEEQARQAFENLVRVLETAGGRLADVVELTTYHVAMDEMAGFAKVKNEFIAADFPAWTAVGVSALVLPELRVEIRATAVLGSGGA